MDSFLTVPVSNATSPIVPIDEVKTVQVDSSVDLTLPDATMAALQQQTSTRGEKSKSELAVDEISQIDLMPMVYELIQKVERGTISAKNVHNEVRILFPFENWGCRFFPGLKKKEANFC
jgi:hypothetical protein